MQRPICRRARIVVGFSILNCGIVFLFFIRCLSYTLPSNCYSIHDFGIFSRITQTTEACPHFQPSIASHTSRRKLKAVSSLYDVPVRNNPTAIYSTINLDQNSTIRLRRHRVYRDRKHAQPACILAPTSVPPGRFVMASAAAESSSATAAYPSCSTTACPCPSCRSAPTI